MRVTLVLGLAGSGKSFVARQLRESTGVEVFDELGVGDTQARFRRCVARGCDCVAIEISLCMPEKQKEMRKWLSGIHGMEQRWVCFENDLATANWNVVNRPEKQDQVAGLLEINDRASEVYEYPSDAEIRPIFRVPKKLGPSST